MKEHCIASDYVLVMTQISFLKNSIDDLKDEIKTEVETTETI